VEFDYADFGALSLQMVYAWYSKYLQKDLALSKFVEKLTTGPNICLQEKASTLEVGQEANITVLDQATNWVFDASTNHSVSKNTHEWNKELSGKIVAVFNNKQVIENI
jgi:dihydroorotase